MCEDLILSQISRDEMEPYLKKTMNEIWLEFFQIEINIPALRNLKIEDIHTTNPQGFAEAYNALVRAAEVEENRHHELVACRRLSQRHVLLDACILFSWLHR